MADTFPVNSLYVDEAALGKFIEANREHVMAIVCFGVDCKPIEGAEFPVIYSHMEQLGETKQVEVWTSSAPVSYHRGDSFEYTENSEALFGQYLFKNDSSSDLEATTRLAYNSCLKETRAAGYPYLIRLWNYLPDINMVVDGLERYMRFCLGRHQALEENRLIFEKELPAASALGTQGGRMSVFLLAAKTPGEPKENPRQVHAYEYPPQYGPRSPSFSRAMLKRWGGNKWDLFISGTASIVGHESQHPGDAVEQLQETLQNIETLIESATKGLNGEVYTVSDLSFLKVYIRHREHYPVVREALERTLKGSLPTMYLLADVCRTNLLLEIEGVLRSK